MHVSWSFSYCLVRPRLSNFGVGMMGGPAWSSSKIAEPGRLVAVPAWANEVMTAVTAVPGLKKRSFSKKWRPPSLPWGLGLRA